MTTETDLLPLPEYFRRDLSHMTWEGLSQAAIDYAHANVAHATDPLQAEIEALRAEVERLQEAVRPKREDECLTLDHWRMRAYYLEENWSRCSRACAVEQGKREKAEARAERLAEALRKWWSAHRPVGWTEDQHRARPYVNLITVADKALAEALMRDQEARND